MQRPGHQRSFALVLAAAALGLSATARADTVITDFGPTFSQWLSTAGANFANWANSNVTTFTQTADSYTIASTGYGSNYVPFLNDQLQFQGINFGADTQIRFEVTVNSGLAGVLLQLFDQDNSGARWEWYGLTPGHYVLTADLNTPGTVLANGATPGLQPDLTSLHMEVDPGSLADNPSQSYSVTYHDLRLTPEPASLALLAAGGLLALRRRG